MAYDSCRQQARIAHEQTVGQFLLAVHGRKHVLEFLLRVRLPRLLSVVKLRQNLASDKNVPSQQLSETSRLFRGFLTNPFPTDKPAEQCLLPRLRSRAYWRDLW